MSATSNQIVQNQHVSLLELLDRLLDKGVMVKGEILLSVADIDLVYLNLGLLLSSVKTVEQAGAINLAPTMVKAVEQAGAMNQASMEEFWDEPPMEIERKDAVPASFSIEHEPSGSIREGTIARTLPSAINEAPDLFQPKTSIDPENVQKGLAKLVLTLVDLLRKLMEKQAIRRIEAGQLDAGEIERVGNTFFLLDEKMEELKKMFGFKDGELNLDLGPLGNLI